MKISKISLKQAKNIYFYILGDFAKSISKTNIEDLAEYLDRIKENHKRYSRKTK